MALKAEAEFIYEDFILHTAPEKFYLEPLQAPNEVLVIDRASKDITLQSKCDQNWHSQNHPEHVELGFHITFIVFFLL